MRRSLTVLATFVVVALIGPPAWASGWRQNDFDAGNTRYNPDETTLTSSTVAGVQLAWEADLSDRAGVVPTPSGPPILAHGILYVAREAGLRALDAETGAPLWRRPLDCGKDKGVSGGVLVVSTCTDGLVGLDPATGDMLWSRPRMPLFDTVFIHDAAYGFFTRTGTPNRLKVAKIDVGTGSILWVKRIPLSFIDLGSTPASLAVDRGTVFISDGYGTSFAADRGRLFGQHRWMAFDADSGDLRGRLVCRVGSYVVNEEMCALDVESEHRLWITDGDDSGPAVTRSSAISATGSWDIATGKLNFRVPGSCQDQLFNPACRPLVAGDVIYTYDDDDAAPQPQPGIFATDLSSGQLLTRIDLSGQYIVADGSIFVTVANGVQAWRLP